CRRLWLVGLLCPAGRLLLLFPSSAGPNEHSARFQQHGEIMFFGKHVRFRLLLLLGIPSVIGVIIGALLSTRLTFRFDELVLGVFLIGFSLFLLWKPTAKVAASNINAITAGGGRRVPDRPDWNRRSNSRSRV